jgi:hypothetical protein
MTEQEIITGNKLIAFSKYSQPDIRTWVDDIGEPSDKFCLKTLDYHNNISSLIDVLENIEKDGCIIEISMSLGRTCRIYQIKTKIEVAAEDMSLINACYKAIVEFLNKTK